MAMENPSALSDFKPPLGGVHKRSRKFEEEGIKTWSLLMDM